MDDEEKRIFTFQMLILCTPGSSCSKVKSLALWRRPFSQRCQQEQEERRQGEAMTDTGRRRKVLTCHITLVPPPPPPPPPSPPTPPGLNVELVREEYFSYELNIGFCGDGGGGLMISQ